MHTTQSPAPALLPLQTEYSSASSPTLAAHVGAAYHAALARGSASDELRVSTCALVGMLKAEGLSPEKALIALKDILMRESRCVSLSPVCCANQESVAIEQGIYAQVFAWYLDAYFETGERSTGRTVR